MNCCIRGNFNPITIDDIDFIKSKLKDYDFVYIDIIEGDNYFHKINMVNIAIRDIDNVYLGKSKNIYELKDSKLNDFKNIDKQVIKYVFDNGLYYQEIVKYNLSDYRFNHSVSVSNMCVNLAKAHNVDINKAYIAGILHDIYKEKSFEENRNIVLSNFKDFIDDNKPYLYHGYSASYFARNFLFIDDEDILEAIFHHTSGNGKSDLAKILFIADKIDPLRGYDISDEYNTSILNLDEGLNLVKVKQINYLKEK